MRTAIIRKRGYTKKGTTWDVEYAGEIIVTASYDPEHAACRVLHERGLDGPIQFFSETGTPSVHYRRLEETAEWSAYDHPTEGLKHRKYVPFGG